MEYLITSVFITSIIITLLVIRKVKFNLLFSKQNDNPDIRICNKCGAHQTLKRVDENRIDFFGTDHQNYIWWVETTPGTDKKCKCKKYLN